MDFVVEVIAHLTTADPGAHQVNLETAMQALVLDPRHPVALEITGEQTAKRFLVRAQRPETLAHAEAQVRMRYLQASFDPVSAADDPLVCRAGEGVSVVELRAGAAPYLPLQTWEEQAMRQPGTDPVLGILAAMTLPPKIRAVAQIAMVPASPNWSKRQQRRALEPALDAEKKKVQEQVQEARQGAPSTLGVLLLIALCGVLVLVPHLTIPLWIGQAIQQVFLGQWPTLSRAHWMQVGGVCLCLIGLPMLGRLLKRPHLYDQKLAAQKTLTMAYRVRIRLYVFGPAEPAVRSFWRTSWQALRQRTLMHEWRILWHEHQNARRVRALRNPALLPTVLANVKQKIIFRMSAKDASIIAPEIGVEPEDIVHLDPHTCYLSLPAAGRQQPTFSLALSPPPVGDPQVAGQIRLQSQPYTRSGSEIDTALQTAITRTIQAKSQKEEKKPDAPTTGRVRTRKGKEDTSAATTKGHGSLQSLELLAASPQTPVPQEEMSPNHADEAEEPQER
jgi:hypothetical protein